jgi:hypothetical protein
MPQAPWLGLASGNTLAAAEHAALQHPRPIPLQLFCYRLDCVPGCHKTHGVISVVHLLIWLVAPAKHGGEAAIDNATLLALVGILTRTLQGTTRTAQPRWDRSVSAVSWDQGLTANALAGLNNVVDINLPVHCPSLLTLCMPPPPGGLHRLTIARLPLWHCSPLTVVCPLRRS